MADEGNNRIDVFNSAGVFQSSFGSSGSGNGKFSFPQGVAVAPTGTTYVADTANERVEIFDSASNFQSSFGSSGSGNGQFSSPLGLTVSATGTVYVSDYENGRVEVFNSSGVYQSSFGSGHLSAPQSVAVSPTGMVYVVDAGNNTASRWFDPGSWVSGTNTFTDPSVGPTTVVVAPGQILGSTLTLTSAMGLVATQLNVNPGGLLTQAGGSVSVTMTSTSALPGREARTFIRAVRSTFPTAFASGADCFRLTRVAR